METTTHSDPEHATDPTTDRGNSGVTPPGPPPLPGAPARRSDRLHRSSDGRMIAGVAAGLADCFDLDPTLVRAGFLALALLGGLAVPVYLAAWLLVPEEGTDVSVAEELLGRERARVAGRADPQRSMPMCHRLDWQYSRGRTRGEPEPAPHLRVSDADRHDVAERLSRHFADGRLDQAEFDARLGRATGAVTRGDLDGLFDDLPRLPDDEPLPRRRRRLVPLAVAVLLLALAIEAAASMVRVPWLLLAVAALVLYRWGRHGHDRHASSGSAH